MLTAEQLETRTRGIGASEVAAILGVDRFKSELDVWATKRRGAKLDQLPLQAAEPDPDTPSAVEPTVTAEPMFVGSIFERAIVEVYEARTGLLTAHDPHDPKAERVATLVHADHSWMMATPDRYVDLPALGYVRGLECKLVGHWMIEDWADETLPARVWMQCQWGMAVSGLGEWDAAALLEGSRFVRHFVERDDAWIEQATNVIGDWRERHIVGDEPPEPRDADDLARMTRRIHGTDNGEALELKEASPQMLADVNALCAQLHETQQQAKYFEAGAKEIKAKLEAMCGPYRSMVCDVGRFAFPGMAGGVAWKKLAEHLNGGKPIPEDIASKFRSPAYRKSQLYKFKDKSK